MIAEGMIHLVHREDSEGAPNSTMVGRLAYFLSAGLLLDERDILSQATRGSPGDGDHPSVDKLQNSGIDIICDSDVPCRTDSDSNKVQRMERTVGGCRRMTS